MPELCEVQIMTDNLSSWMVGHQLVLNVLDSKLHPLIESFKQNQVVNKVYRRAKFSLILLEDQAICIHYRMTGQVVVESKDTRFVRLRFQMSNGQHIAFVDPRKFGTIDCVAHSDLPKWIEDKNLGQEIWPVKRDANWWEQTLSGLRAPIKNTLLRQDRIVGIGNILASEFCFEAKISPLRPTDCLTGEEWHRLALASHRRINIILQEERSEKIGFLHEGVIIPAAFQVYGREGQFCTECNHVIHKIRQAGRSTYLCSVCQV